MIKPGAFHIGSNSRYWYVRNSRGETLRRFSTKVWSHEEVKAWRLGYVAGLNAR